jgi:hypothetical protein
MGSNSGHSYGTEVQKRFSREAGATTTSSRRDRVGSSRGDRDGDDAPRSYLPGIVLALVALFSFPAQSSASELKEQTLAEWNDYVRSACLRAEGRAKASPFLRISELPERRARGRAGEIIVWREGNGHPATVPHGLIHDWAGAVFIPNATIADVFAVVRDYDHYSEIYKPAVIEAKGLGSHGDDDSFSMLLVQKVLFVTAAVQGEYDTQYIQIDAKHWYSVSQSTRLQTVARFGQEDMRVLPPDRGPGYIWRLYSFTRFEESDGGVYVEVEAIGLSRDVPILFRWLVDPVVEHLPRDSVHDTLEKTRNAVLERLSRQD